MIRRCGETFSRVGREITRCGERRQRVDKGITCCGGTKSRERRRIPRCGQTKYSERRRIPCCGITFSLESSRAGHLPLFQSNSIGAKQRAPMHHVCMTIVEPRIVRSEAILAAASIPDPLAYYKDVLGFPHVWDWGAPPDFGGA